MASQLRLQVVLPVAVLAILGLGVGAFALGKPPTSGGGASPTPPPPAQTGTTTKEARPESRWATRTNDWCEGINEQFDVLELPENRSELEAYLVKANAILDKAARQFPSLGWPGGKKDEVLELRSALANEAEAGNAALAALHAGDTTEFEEALTSAARYGKQWNKGTKALGVGVCGGNSLAAGTSRALAKYGSAEAALNHELLEHRVVVVLFYAPGDDYDAIQTRETRAGALAAHAGFLALNVNRNSQVAALAAKFDVRDAPATLIFKRGPAVAYRVAGYLDRDAIAQAAANAGA
jgi:hypothetical protein